MTELAQMVEVRHRSVRSVNLEHDLGNPAVLGGYAVGEHIVDTVRRVLIGCQDGQRTRAWSITGPYGVGKSSFAHFLCSLLGASKSPTFKAANKSLRATDVQLADTLGRERRRLELAERGVIVAAVTAEREPILRTLARSLWRGAEAYWSRPGRKPDVLHQLHALTHGHDAVELSVGALLDALEALYVAAPVVVVIDELGKTLEYAADRSVEGDLFALQQIAEGFSASERMLGCIVTLQHLAFEDYLVGASELRRREWRKVHGRFEDVPFVSTGGHARRLIAEALELADTPATPAIRDACARAQTGLSFPALENPAEHYPLHPTVAAALPNLTARLGQHDRSLVAFLTSDAPHGLLAFLVATSVSDSSVPFLRLYNLYDYFFEDGAAVSLAGPDGALAREIASRIDDAQDLTPLERRVLKTVGVLNVVSGADGLVAGRAIIEEALAGPDGGRRMHAEIRQALDALTERSLLTFREFAGEYRVWQGSDFDLLGQLRAARERLAAERVDDDALLDLVSAARPLRPVVARRHSQANGTLRFFESRYAPALGEDEPECTLLNAVGLVIHVLADTGPPRKLPTQTVDGRPLLVIWSARGREVREAALDVGAAMAVLSSAPELDSDPVARREVRHRLDAAQAALAELIDAVLADSEVSWYREGRRHKPGGQVAFSRLLSDICDMRYSSTPRIDNEMLNRCELTSQGAKARRELLERMFTHETYERLGIEGYGPERAMYEAVLHETGLHRNRDGRWGFGPPPAGSPLAKVWSFMEDFLDAATDEPRGVDKLFAGLEAPPFGMKEGPLPVMLAAILQFRSDDIFLYQDGTFHPVVEPALIERLLKAPSRFTIKRAALIGLRATVFEELREILDVPATVPTRNATTLAVVRPLISLVRELPRYATTTKHVSERAQLICATLLAAREPDELLFTALPQVCDIPPFAAKRPNRDRQLVSDYVGRLRGGLAELSAAYGQLLDRIGALLHEAFDVPGPRSALRENLRVRAETVRQHVIEPRMRAMLLAAIEQSTDEREWLETLGMTLTSKPTASWSDQDVVLFEAATAERAAWFKRLELLHFQLAAGDGRGFASHRLTVTAPDGTEAAELVSVEVPTHDVIADVLDEALAKLEETLGTQAQRALLGVLAERLLADAAATAKSNPATKKAVQV
jgi:hypothetical protein